MMNRVSFAQKTQIIKPIKRRRRRSTADGPNGEKNKEGVGGPSSKKKYDCEVCDKSYVFSSSLNWHNRTQHREPKLVRAEKKKQITRKQEHVCDICGKGFQTSQGFVSHRKTHNSEKQIEVAEKSREYRKVQCLYCDQIFNEKLSQRRHHIKAHSVIHLVNQPYFCKLCCYAYATEEELSKHLESSHFKCQYCPRQFTNNLKLSDHENIHTGNRPYQCLECGKTFNCHSSLATHKKLHKPERPFQCTICSMEGKIGARYVLQCELNKHIRRNHPGEASELIITNSISNYPN